jgi:pyruvate carboxylase
MEPVFTWIDMEMTNNKEYLFVYGTLRRGGGSPFNKLLSEQADLVGLGSFRGKLYDLGEYPGVIPSSNPADAVIGEIYAIHNDSSILVTLDKYEDYLPDQPERSLYLRQLAPISAGENKTLQAWIYLYNGSINGCKQITTGDYLHYLNSSGA